MKLAYCNEGISISETFIFDLASALSKRVEVFEFIGGTPMEMDLDFSYRNLEYIRKDNFFHRHLNSLLTSDQRFRRSVRFAQKKLTSLQPSDVAYIDYGTTAVRFDEALRKRKIPYIVHFHGFDISSALSNVSYRRLLKEVFKNAFAVVAPSYHLKRLLILQGCPEEKIHMIRYGFNASSIEPMPWKERVKERPRVIFVGRLTPKKNPLALIHAFAKVVRSIPSAQLTVVGDGPLMGDCKALADKLQLNKCIFFLGAIPRDRIFPILNQHWIYAQHSVTPYNGDQEGFPLSLAEAALHELPLVSTIHSGITENIVDGVTGFVVQEYNYEAMAEKIIYLIQNPEVAERMGKAGRERISKECILHDRVEKIFELLKQASR